MLPLQILDRWQPSLLSLKCLPTWDKLPFPGIQMVCLQEIIYLKQGRMLLPPKGWNINHHKTGPKSLQMIERFQMSGPGWISQDRNKCADLPWNISVHIQKHMDMSRMLIYFVTHLYILTYNWNLNYLEDRWLKYTHPCY